MEIFGIGPFELLLIALITFVVLGPERIPPVMRQVGRAVRRLREMTQQITKDYGADIQQLTGEITQVQNELRGVQRDLGQMARGMINQAPTVKPTATNPPTPAAVKDPSPPAEPSAPTTLDSTDGGASTNV